MWRPAAVALVSILVSACASLWPQPYGELAADADPVRADGQPNQMPPNAPSTLNGYWADDDGHQGIDILGDIGTPVLAPAPGTVIESRFGPMYGHRIVIDHGIDTNGHAVRTLLVHLDRRQVSEGETVSRGQTIANLGRTGLLAIAIPHLHYEVYTRVPQRFRIFEPRNPHLFWADGPGIVTCFDSARSYPERGFSTTYPVPCRDTDWQLPTATGSDRTGHSDRPVQ